MADTIFTFELIFSFPNQIQTDDGSGTDWIIIEGLYDFPSNPMNFGAEISLGATQSLGWIYFLDQSNTVSTLPCQVVGRIENAQGGMGNELLNGSAFANVLAGDPTGVPGGTDILRGFNGYDTLIGGGGSDSLFGGKGDDLILGDTDPNSDRDAFRAVQGDDTLSGGEGFDSLTGGGGTNRIDGGGRIDAVLYSYFFDDTGDGTFHVDVNLSTGHATVVLTDNFGDHTVFAQDTITKVEDAVGTGGDDHMTGIDATRRGSALSGEGGNDTLTGGTGKDTLDGGNGSDLISGGGNADVFRFASSSASAVGVTRDQISDFSHRGDVIDLSQIQPNQTFTTSAGFDLIAGQIIYDRATGILSGDTDGDGFANYEIGLLAGTTLTAADLLL